MNILNTAACSVFSNNNLHNWCMNSTYAPYVILTGTVLAGCVLAKVCSSTNRALPSQHESALPPLAGRVGNNEETPTSPAARIFPPHRGKESSSMARVARPGDLTASAKREKAQLAGKVQALLIETGTTIGLKNLPPYANDDQLLSLGYLKVFGGIWSHHLATLASKYHLDIPAKEMEPIISSSKQFNAALELLVDFYLGIDDFETALQYGLLARPFENRSILFKLVNPLIESNLLEKAKETLKQMKDFKDGKGELLTKLGKKYLAQSPPQMENAKKLLGMMLSSEAVDLATSIIEKHIERKELKEALKIVTNSSLAFSLGDNKKTYLMTIIDKHIGANQLEEAYKIVTDPSFGWLLGDNKKTYLTTIAEKYSSIGEHAKAKRGEEMMGSRFQLQMGLDPFPC